MPLSVSRVGAALGLLGLATAHGAGAQEAFNGRVTIDVAEHWPWTGPPGLPRLSVDLATVQSFRVEGHCLRTSVQRDSLVLTIRIRGIYRCGSDDGELIAPASARLPIGTADSIGALPTRIRLLQGRHEDDYKVWATWFGLKTIPLARGSFSALADPRRVKYVREGTFQVSCFGQFFNPGLCDALLKVVLFRGHMTSEAIAADERTAYGPLSDTTTKAIARSCVFLANPIRLDSLLALAADFTRVFDGANADVYASPALFISFHLWDNRYYQCGKGRCRKVPWR
jgi:hypothetical protein